jgi:hypothetical protein
MAQCEFIRKTGLQVEFSPSEQPYSNPRTAIFDITQNNHFYVTSTRSAFGQDGIDPNDTNPLLAETDENISGEKALINDIFRIVHDFFGHAKEGLGFRSAGEENAWRGHATMYSPLTRRALVTELRSQNCWVNWGPHGDTNRTAGMDDTVFAEQKLGLLPEWVAWEGAADPVEESVAVPVEQPTLIPIQTPAKASSWGWVAETLTFWMGSCMGRR